jgi:hypothetical protein
VVLYGYEEGKLQVVKQMCEAREAIMLRNQDAV